MRAVVADRDIPRAAIPVIKDIPVVDMAAKEGILAAATDMVVKTVTLVDKVDILAATRADMDKDMGMGGTPTSIKGVVMPTTLEARTMTSPRLRHMHNPIPPHLLLIFSPPLSLSSTAARTRLLRRTHPWTSPI